jgi:hypothetical protein
MKRKHRSKKRDGREISPVTMLTEELVSLRRDLRKTVRAYTARLELDLAESAASVALSRRTESLSRERLHDIRDLTIMLRKRRLKPQKGRRKDLRKIDSLICDLRSVIHPDACRIPSR